MAIRAILFDLFDTLVDLRMDRLPAVSVLGRSAPSTYGVLHDALRPHADLDFERFATALAQLDGELRKVMQVERIEVPTVRRFTLLLERLGVEGPGLAEELTAAHMDRLVSVVAPIPHHADVLGQLHGRVRLGVCSNFTHTPTARRVLEESGLLRFFDAVVVSEEVGIRKPRPEIFEAALARLGTRPGETLHVGDNLAADVGGAAAVGMATAWITRRVADPARALRAWDGAPPAHRVRDLAELIDLLD